VYAVAVQVLKTAEFVSKYGEQSVVVSVTGMRCFKLSTFVRGHNFQIASFYITQLYSWAGKKSALWEEMIDQMLLELL